MITIYLSGLSMGVHLTSGQREHLEMDQKTIRALSTRLTNAKHRCTISKNPHHIKHYQDKGIQVCDEWLASRFEYLKWAKDKFKPEFELDRIDNSKGYSPTNCRFVSKTENLRNRTNTRSEEIQRAVRLLERNGFSRRFTARHFPT